MLGTNDNSSFMNLQDFPGAIWGPTLMSVLWSAETDWEKKKSGWTDSLHPSRSGLNKYKRLAWDALGGPDFLSIKVMDGWNFTEYVGKIGICSFESYAREMKLLLKTDYVGHVIDALQTMVQLKK